MVAVNQWRQLRVDPPTPLRHPAKLSVSQDQNRTATPTSRLSRGTVGKNSGGGRLRNLPRRMNQGRKEVAEPSGCKQQQKCIKTEEVENVDEAEGSSPDEAFMA